MIHAFLALALVFLFSNNSVHSIRPSSPIWLTVSSAPAKNGPTGPDKAHRSISSPGEMKKQPPKTTSAAKGAPSAVASYENRIRAILEERVRYPEIARRLGQEGEVILALEVENSGRILWSKLQSPSPYSSLNESAMEGLAAIDRFPPLPEGTASVVVEIPLIFSL